MASSISSTNPPFLSSSPSSTTDLRQWLHRFTTTLQNHLSDNLLIPLPFCIFQLPQALTSDNPDSYLPKHIGLGPIHHFRPDLYPKQQQLKIITSKAILEHYNVTSEFDKFVTERLLNLSRVARYCYDLYLDIEDETLAWIFAVDGLFLADVITKASDGRPSDAFEDVVMLENQIPFVILVVLLNALEQKATDGFDVLNLLVEFCEERLPLKFDTPITKHDLITSSGLHLLDCMYRLIVNHNLPPENPFLRMQEVTMEGISLGDVEVVVQMAGGLCPPLNVFLQPILVLLKLPWDKIGAFVKKMFSETPTKPKIDIPSASRLAGIGKIEFCTNHGGLHDIGFDESKLTFTLPVLDLKPNSEVLLRNLVAYEGLMYEKRNIKNLIFTEYLDLMCGIIVGIKDVKILKEKSIIKGNLKDDEIVKLFNGISKSGAKTENKSELQTTIANVNNYFGNIPRVRVYRAIKKAFLASWKIFATMFSVLSVVVMILVAVCQVYECKSRFGLGYVGPGFAYATGYKQLVDL